MSDTHTEQMKDFLKTRREAFLDAAAEILARQGIRKTTMDELAAQADVAKVVLYRYFGAKDKLVHEVLERITDQLLDADAKGSDWWTERVRSTLEVARGNRDAIILLVRHSAHDPEYMRHFERLQAALVERVIERLDEIFLDAKPIGEDKIYLGETITTFFLNAYLRWLETGAPDEDDAFFEWVTRSVQSMSYHWYQMPLPDPDKAA